MDCPKCPVGKLNELTIRLHVPGPDRQLKVDQCFTCEGIWFDSGELEQYLVEKLKAINSAAMPDEALQELDQQVGKCPRCHTPMSKQPSPTKRKVIVDYCRKCQGFWLDCTEVDRMEPRPGVKDLVEDFLNYLSTITGRR